MARLKLRAQLICAAAGGTESTGKHISLSLGDVCERATASDFKRRVPASARLTFDFCGRGLDIHDVGDCDGGSLLCLCFVLVVESSVDGEAVRSRDIACNYSNELWTDAECILVLRQRLDVDHISKFRGKVEEREDHFGRR